MIISRTPFRISFFGGGTDYPDWYLKHGGSVLATAIDKYCYITCRYLPPFFEHRIRIVYSKLENCQRIEEIQHPSVRETIRFLKIDRGLEIHHDGDLPARSGMGSSSSFTVGLLNALYALQGKMVSKQQLATNSIHIEQNMIQETVTSFNLPKNMGQVLAGGCPNLNLLLNTQKIGLNSDTTCLLLYEIFPESVRFSVIFKRKIHTCFDSVAGYQPSQESTVLKNTGVGYCLS